MDTNDRQTIEELFHKLDLAERSGGAAHRDAEAEALIRERMGRQPGAAYYMAQTIVVQEHALQAAQERIEGLERELASRPAASGGLLASLFGGGQPQPATHYAASHGSHSSAGTGWSASARPGAFPGVMPGAPGGYARSNGGFLAGAAQTAMGVAGGVVLGGLIGSAIAGAGVGTEQATTAQQAAGELQGLDDFAGEFDSEPA